MHLHYRTLLYARLTAALLSCFLLLCGHSLRAQIEGNILEPQVQNNQVPFTISCYSTKQGLPQNQVTQIWRKRTGELVLHTYNGIVEFNGFHFRPITKDKKYNNETFRAIYYFRNRDLLLGFNQRLYAIAPEYRQIGLEDLDLLYGAFGNDSLYLISKKAGIYLYDPDSETAKLLFSDKESPLVRKPVNIESCVVKGRNIYLSTAAGLFCIRLDRQKIDLLSSLPFNKLKLNPHNGKIYASSGEQLFRIEGDSIKPLKRIRTHSPFRRVMDMLFTGDSTFYLATANGLIHAGKDSTVHYTTQNGMPSPFLHALFADPVNQCIYIGSAEKGLIKLQFRNNYPFHTSDNLYKKSVASIIRAPDGQVITSSGPSFYSLHSHSLDSLDLVMQGREEYASLASINGLIYAGNWGRGISLFRNYRLVDSILAPAQIPGHHVFGCFKDSRGMIWIGTDKGIARGRSEQEIRPAFGKLFGKRTICFYELKDGSICIGSVDGATILRNDSLIARLDTSNGFRGREVRSFCEQENGRVWIGTYGGGLYCYEKGRFSSINAMRGCMLDRDAFCLARDRLGYFYMTSNHGLWRVSIKDLNDFYDQKLSYLIPFHYMEETGFTNTEFNGGFQNNMMPVAEGFLFPTLEGIIKTVPEKPVYMPLIPKISDIWVNDTLAASGEHSFGRRTYSLQLNFECLNFVSKNNIYFQYRLAGETGSDWSKPQKQPFVQLKMLPPGKYTFMVRAIDGFNERNPLVASYSFEIRPYVFETIWFRIVAATLLAGITVMLIRSTIIRNRRKISLKDHYKRKINEVELQAIQAQLNPHFIFNCMNTIKYFILEKDFANANDGLNRLSKLIRSSLENSEKMFIPLRQEIPFIRNFVELKKMRLGELLSYTLNVDGNVNTETLVPYLIIQPYVENAIKHGIANLEDRQGVLSIHFSQAGDSITCTIEDNGIGRVASGRLENRGLYNSKGMKLTADKCQLLKQYYNYNCDIAIEDLYDGKGKSRGTRVVIVMSGKYKTGNSLSL